MESYNKALTEALIGFFKENISEITFLCFSRGLAKDKKDWSEYLWYINTVDMEVDIDEMYEIDKIANKSKTNSKTITYGSKNGGSTVLLPFGFVQWHQGKMQFHHNKEKIEELMKSK